MIVLLFAILWGGLLALLLSSPYSYYPLFIAMAGGSGFLFYVSRRFLNSSKKILIPVFVALFLASFSLCSLIIFKPADFHYGDTSSISKDKKAVIFYCEGEMEKYTPYYANSFFKEIPVVLKPFYSLKLKHMYKKMGVNPKNNDLLQVAMEVKSSILNYNPYYFYAAFSGYFPNTKDAIEQAIMDGCGDITILNYSSDSKLPEKLQDELKLKDLQSLGINIKISKPVYESKLIVDLFTEKITHMSLKADGIILIDDVNSTSSELKNSLIENGYKDSQIIISRDIDNSVNSLKSSGAKSILYVELSESSSGLKSELETPKLFNKHSSSDLKITGIKGWGYNKLLVKAAVDTFVECEKK